MVVISRHASVLRVCLTLHVLAVVVCVLRHAEPLFPGRGDGAPVLGQCLSLDAVAFDSCLSLDAPRFGKYRSYDSVDFGLHYLRGLCP